MKILYGLSINESIDVTCICLSKLTSNNIIAIPQGDINRSVFFTDPFPNILKKIIIVNDSHETEYNADKLVKINIIDNSIHSTCQQDIDDKIKNIHNKLIINHGCLNDELPEQKMVVRYLTGNEKILEIGGNIGRNSLVIASILQDSSNLVTLETDVNISKQLIENRDLNKFKFHVENSALSNRRLIQKGWDTIPSDILKKDHFWVNTITLENLKTKYNIDFDTLVLDCEGAFYYILMDMPELLNNINLIIMENDYYDISKKNYVDEILIKHNFYKEYSESGGWGPCSPIFLKYGKNNL